MDGPYHSIFEGLGTPRNGHPPELSFSLGAPPPEFPLTPRNFRAFGAISPYDPPDGHPPEFFSASGHPPEIREFRGGNPPDKDAMVLMHLESTFSKNQAKEREPIISLVCLIVVVGFQKRTLPSFVPFLFTVYTRCF